MNQIKFLRILMLLILVVFVGVVIKSYRSGKTISDRTADEDLRRLVGGEQLIQKEFNQKNYEKEELETEISARELVNYQDGVNVLENFHLTRGADGMDVRSDFGRHDPEKGDSFLWQNVQISDGQGMTIKTESALHDQTAGMVIGNKPVEFSHNRLRGSSLGFLFNTTKDSQELQLPADVEMTIFAEEGSEAEPVAVRAGFLKLVRKSGLAFLTHGVSLKQGRLSLRCQTMRIEFDEAGRRLLHLSAYGDVVLAMAELDEDTGPPADPADHATAGVNDAGGVFALGGDPGRKTLHARKLEVFFPRESVETMRLEYLVARGAGEQKAVLRLYPAAADGDSSSEIRQLEGERLVFRFRSDGQPNRLDSFHAQGGCLLRIDGSGPEEVRLTGETLSARFDATQQDLMAAEITGDVLCTRGLEQIRGDRASFDAIEQLLYISGEANGRLPRLWNDTMELEAQRLVYAVDGQLLQAEEDVWVKVQGRGGDKGLDVALFSDGNAEEPVYIHADRLQSDLEAGVTTFQGSVRLLKGDNVLSARKMWLYHNDRRMEALERVSLIIHPPAGAEDAETVGRDVETALPAVEQLTKNLPLTTLDTSPPTGRASEEGVSDGEAFDNSAPLQITCGELTYDDQGRYIILDDRVSVRKHRTRLTADHMEVQLDQEVNRILHIIASATGAVLPDVILPGHSREDHLITGFDRQAQRLRGSGPVMAPVGDTPPNDDTVPVGGLESGEAGGPAVGTGRPAVTTQTQIPQVSISQPGGRSAAGERILYYPGEQVAVLLGLDTVATVVDPRSGSAQGTTLTYNLADGKILNRANENEVTLILLHSGMSSADGAGSANRGPTRGARNGRAASTRSAGAGPAGRSSLQ
jgi:lipopolysaccharide export system protein LptA